MEAVWPPPESYTHKKECLYESCGHTQYTKKLEKKYFTVYSLEDYATPVSSKVTPLQSNKVHRSAYS